MVLQFVHIKRTSRPYIRASLLYRTPLGTTRDLTINRFDHKSDSHCNALVILPTAHASRDLVMSISKAKRREISSSSSSSQVWAFTAFLNGTDDGPGSHSFPFLLLPPASTRPADNQVRSLARPPLCLSECCGGRSLQLTSERASHQNC